MTNDRIWILLTRKLSGEATQTELEELEQIIDGNAEKAELAEQVTGSWNEEPIANGDFLEATYLLHLERMKQAGIDIIPQPATTAEVEPFPPQKKSRLRWLIPVITLAIMLFAGWRISENIEGEANIKQVQHNKVATTNGNRTKLLLPDGSSVWLNSGSQLTYTTEFEKGKTREVTLKGEAFFDVVKNAQRPFIIHTDKLDVKVLGTRFNVKAYPGDKTTETSLIRGKVEVYLHSKPAEKYVLHPSEKLVLLNEVQALGKLEGNQNLSPDAAKEVVIKPLSYLSGTHTDIESSWTRNILSFQDESFADVAKKIERWYDVKFEFDNTRWNQERLNGSFEDETLEQAMIALQYSTGFEYKRKGNTIHIY